MRFSTEDLPERDRVAAFQDIYAQSIIRHDIEPLPESPLHFSATFHALPGVTVASGICSALHATRTPRHIDNDDVVLNVSLTGGRVLRQRNREALVRPGEAILAASADVGVASVLELSQFISLRFPFRSIAPLLADLDDAFVRTVPHNLHALQMLVGYVRLMDRDFACAAPELRRLAAAHIQDLTALAIGATRDATEIARGRGIRAARLLSMKRDIAENIGRRDLSAESVGARHGISASYVRKLFEADGSSFTEFVLSQRVARAHRMLSSPRFAARAIGTIAFDVGFSDLSYFNRVFRRHYGVTPSDVRDKTRN
jgi:AraC-like DNA-binding protein